MATKLNENYFPTNLELNYDPNEFIHHHPSQSLFFNPVDHDELLAIILSLKNKSSVSAFDGISFELVKKIALQIVDVLSYIINLSLSSGSFPSSLKTAVIIPLFKKGDSTLLNNYRPISLLSVFAKILEKVVKRRLLDFLDKHNFLSDSQYGFRENRGTEDALYSFLSDIYNGLNNNKQCVGLFVDISKAFDMVDHSILLKIMESIGIRGVALKWFKIYLTGCIIRTKVQFLVMNSFLILGCLRVLFLALFCF